MNLRLVCLDSLGRSRRHLAFLQAARILGKLVVGPSDVAATICDLIRDAGGEFTGPWRGRHATLRVLPLAVLAAHSRMLLVVSISSIGRLL